MSIHKKTIAAISWCPQNRDLLATCADDGHVIVWNVSTQSIVGDLLYTKSLPRCVQWCLHERDTVSFVTATIPLLTWRYTTADVQIVKETQALNTDICRFTWHPKKAGKMAFGHVDGSLSILTLRHKALKNVLRPETLDADDDDPVICLQWDPLSVDYLLVAYTHNGVQLVDVDKLTIVTVFQLPSASMRVHTLSWIPEAPGMFLTGDGNNGIMRLWTVAKQTPVENIKLKKTGFHALHVVTDLHNSSHDHHSNDSDDPIVSSTSQTKTPVVDTVTRLALPPSCVVCTFRDGGVGLYDLGRRRWLYLRDEGHIETIFDCQFKPDDANRLATASFDGSIKIWDVTTFKAVQSSPGNEGIVYSLSWAPSDLNCIFAGTARMGAFIWDISKSKIIKRYTEHGMNAIYSVSWNKIESRRLMSCGADWYCVVRLVDGTIVHRYRHPGVVYGCDWSPHNKDMLVTGCDDKCLRVFYVTANTDQPLKLFSGHTAKVFHVRWCPLREGILCSGSDDGSIRIWDYTQEACVNVLQQHSAPVRGLIWNTELPYMLISGSWDSSIRVWDTRDGACIDMAVDHGADVYGLASHPTRPFILASCSRDSTLRLWSLNSLIQPLEMRIIAQHPWSAVMYTAADNTVSQCPPTLLSGKASKDIRRMIESSDSNVYQRTLRLFSKFFHAPCGTDNLLELVGVVQGMSDSLLSPNYSNGIMHHKHVIAYKASHAQELEMIRMSKFGGGIGAPTRDDRLREAADTFIKLGNVERYCELKVNLGEWERALAVAPGVSMDYWQSLMQRYTEHLIKEDSDDIVPFSMSIGDSHGLISYLKCRGRLDDALLVSHTAAEGCVPRAAASGSSVSCKSWDDPYNGYSDDDGDSSHIDSQHQLMLRENTSQHIADWYFRNGFPTLAACTHLAVDDVHNTLMKLIRGHQLELAVCVGVTLKKCQALVDVALEYLSRRCERLDLWELGVDLLNMSSDKERPLMQLCARCVGSRERIDNLHYMAGFPSVENCVKEGERLESEGDTYKSICYYSMSTEAVKGLSMGLSHIRDVLRNRDWVVDDVIDILQMIACIRNDTLQKQPDSVKAELLIMSAYIGTLIAIRRHYYSIVPALFSHTILLLDRYKLELNISVVDVTTDLDAWQMVHVLKANSLSLDGLHGIYLSAVPSSQCKQPSPITDLVE